MPRYVDIDKIKLMSEFKDADGELMIPLKAVRQQILQAEADVGDRCKIKIVEKICKNCDHYEMCVLCNVTNEICSFLHTCDRFE